VDIETINLLRQMEDRIIGEIRKMHDVRSVDALEKIVELLEGRPNQAQPVKLESVGFSIDKRVIILGILAIGVLIIVASLGGEALRMLLNTALKAHI